MINAGLNPFGVSIWVGLNPVGVSILFWVSTWVGLNPFWGLNLGEKKWWGGGGVRGLREK